MSIAGRAQGVGQMGETLAGTDRITFATITSMRQVRIDLREVTRLADLRQPPAGRATAGCCSESRTTGR